MRLNLGGAVGGPSPILEHQGAIGTLEHVVAHPELLLQGGGELLATKLTGQREGALTINDSL